MLTKKINRSSLGNIMPRDGNNKEIFHDATNFYSFIVE